MTIPVAREHLMLFSSLGRNSPANALVLQRHFIGKVLLQHTTKMPPIQNYDMIQAFAANRSDQSFPEGILPGTSRCSHHFMAKDSMRRRNASP
jgi:hypothetical protein